MMDDQPIYRPSGFIADEWDSLTREEQIQWWRAQDSDSEDSDEPHPLQALELYRRIIITKRELPSFVFVRVSSGNVREFVSACPRDLLEYLQGEAEDLPADNDDEGWASLMSIHGGNYDPWVTYEEICAVEGEQDRRFRAGVQVFRKALEEHFRKLPG